MALTERNSPFSTSKTDRPCTVPEAARKLGIPRGTLERWLRELGAPVEWRGKKGRGHSTRVIP
jgi:transposase-like protein